MSIWFPFRSLFRIGPVSEDWTPPLLLEEQTDEMESRRAVSPTAAPVHVLSGSALVRVKESTLVVERPDEPVFERPLELISAVHIHGWAGITSPAVAALLRQGAPVVWRGATGFPIGCSLPLHGAGMEVRREQYRNADTARGLEIARTFVAAKVSNMRGVVRRKATLRGRERLAFLTQSARSARTARNVEQLLGIEGAATAHYFGAWPDLLTERAGEIEWQGRNRRPPRDIINAMLSYAYALVAGECLCAAASAGLDPRVGFLHKPRAGRAALALDLMEPFRPLIADQAVLAGLNTGQIDPDTFIIDDAGMRFTDDGRRQVIDLVEKRMRTSIALPGRSEPVTYRQAIGVQAQAIANALRTGEAFAAMERA